MGRDFVVFPLVSQVYLFHRRGPVWPQSCNNSLSSSEYVCTWCAMTKAYSAGYACIMALCPRTLNSTVTCTTFTAILFHAVVTAYTSVTSNNPPYLLCYLPASLTSSHLPSFSGITGLLSEHAEEGSGCDTCKEGEECYHDYLCCECLQPIHTRKHAICV